jgi:hypothetical protein
MRHYFKTALFVEILLRIWYEMGKSGDSQSHGREVDATFLEDRGEEK